MSECKNCGTALQGHYCHQCGQHARVRRIDASYFVSEISETILQVNRGFFYSIKELFIRPGTTIRTFLEGQRKPHFRPMALVLTLSAAYAFLTHLAGGFTHLSDALSGFVEGINNYEETSVIPSTISHRLNWIENNHAWLTLLSIPLYAFITRWVFGKYNYLEHIVIQTLLTAQSTVIYIIMMLVSLPFSMDFVSVAFFLSISYFSVSMLQLFNKGSLVWRLLKVFLVLVLMLLLASIIMSLFFAHELMK